MVVSELLEQENGRSRKTRIAAWNIFRFADCLDMTMMIAGYFLSIVNGITISPHIVLFGEIVNAFLYHFTTTRTSESVNASFSTYVQASLHSLNMTCDELAQDYNASRQIFKGATSNSSIILCGLTNRVVSKNAILFACDPNARLQSEIRWFSLYYVFLGGVALVAGFFSVLCWNISAHRQTRRIRKILYRSILQQEIGWFDFNSATDLSTLLIDEVELIRAAVGDKINIFVNYLSVAFGVFVTAFVISYKLALVMSVVILLIVIELSLSTKAIVTFAKRERSAYAVADAVAEEAISYIRTVVAFGGEERELERYDAHLTRAQKESYRKQFFVSLAVALFFFTFFCSYAIGFWYGDHLFLECEIFAGSVVQVFFCLVMGSVNVINSLPEVEAFASAIFTANSLYKIIDRHPLLYGGKGTVLDTMEGNIQFRDVVFSYPAHPNLQVLKGLDLEINCGQRVALVGPSGCGKSTVVQLIQRFYDPYAGQITIDGHEVSSLNLKWLRSHIGVVSQEPVLFDTTITENICYGKEDATMEEILEAAKKANAHDFITMLPDGYETDVGSKGTQLSGGQKQRIAIARALLRDPKILLLDEATSALDTESEAVVQDALDKAREGRTTIVIARRLSTIQNADIIFSLEKGYVVEKGTHVELMERGGLYYNLMSTQTIEEASEEASKQASSYGSIGEDTHSKVSEEEEEDVTDKTATDLTPLLREVCKSPERELPPREVSFKELMMFNKPDCALVVTGVLLSILLGTVFPVMSIIFGFVTTAFGQRNREETEEQIQKLCIGFVALAFYAGLLYFFSYFTLGLAGEKLTKRLSHQCFQAILRQEIGWFDQVPKSAGAFIAKLSSDAKQVKGITGSRLGLFSRMTSSIVFAVIVGMATCWELSLFVVIAFPIQLLVGFVEVELLARLIKMNKENLEESGQLTVESIENIRTVVGLGVEETLLNEYTKHLAAPFKKSMKGVLVVAVVTSIVQSLIFFLYAATYSLGAFLVVDGRAVYNQIFVVITCTIFTAILLGRAMSNIPDLAKAEVAASRIVHLLERESRIDACDLGGQKLGTIANADIALKSVHFNYPDVKVLQGMSIAVKPGQTLALVGPGECGKSTVAALVERFYDPIKGALTLEGVDLRELNLKWLRTQIGLVSQEPVLFDATVAENIQYGALFREVSDEEVVEAAKSANIHSFIESLPEGYSTNVGPMGFQLSGGQKQRIAIARALLRDPQILLLDEVTSALDTESENLVQDALDKARMGRTTIVMAHSLSTIYNPDVVAVIQNGRVLESGTHSELMALKGTYYLLNTIQRKP